MIDMIESPNEKSTELTTLPPAARAAVALNSSKAEADLKQLATNLKAITLVNSPAGREQAHSLAMTARSARTAIEKAGKAARDDATKFSKAVIAEEDRLIGLIQPEETRVLGLRNAWDAAEAARKEAEAQKERDRIDRHQTVIDEIKVYPSLARDARTSAMALQMLNKLTAIDIEGLEEFKDAAHAAMVAAEKTINDIIEAKQTHEAEQSRIKAEQEAEAARLAEQARVQAEQQAELIALQARMKAQQEELDRQAAAMAQQAAELEARKAEAEKPPVLSEKSVSDEKVRNFIDAVWPDPVIVSVPATVGEIPVIVSVPVATINTTPEKAPTAISLAYDIAVLYSVAPAIAIRWLVERTDEFKTLAESNK